MIEARPLLRINNINITPYIVLGSWNVNEKDVYETWEDANRLIHRGKIRTRVSGDFTVKFVDISAYEQFLDTMNDPVNKNSDGSGTFHCLVYLNNKKTTKTIDAFLDFECSDYIPILGSNEDEGISVTLEER